MLALGVTKHMGKPSEPDFQVRPEVADLYAISFILCGMFFCKRCNASPPEDRDAKPYADRAYYRTAELAYEQGWRPATGSEYEVLCPVCVAQQGHAGDARNARA
jgi:hypothetical protein